MGEAHDVGGLLRGSYPVNLVLTGRDVLLVGGGKVATAKARNLCGVGALVHVVAPRVSPELAELAVSVERRPYRAGDLAHRWLAVAATDDPRVNRRVFLDGEAAGVWVNAADDPANCSVTLPAVVRRGDLLVTVSTGGASPAVASWLRTRIDRSLGPEFDELVRLVADVRSAVMAQGRPTEGLDWRAALDSGMLDLVREGRLEDARAQLVTLLAPPE